MKGIKTSRGWATPEAPPGSDHCPAMKGIKTQRHRCDPDDFHAEATTVPQ